MGKKKNNLLNIEKFDSTVLYITISAIIFISFIIRLKVFEDFPDIDSYVMPMVANFYTYHKLIWLTVTVSLLAILFIYRLIKYKVKIDINYVLIGTGLICIAAIISTIFSSNRDIAVLGFYTRTNGLIAYLSLFLLMYIISTLKVQTKHIRFIVHMVNLASIVFVIIGIFEFFGMHIMNAMWYKQLYVPESLKHLISSINTASIPFPSTPYYWISSILVQYNYFGVYCSIMFPLLTIFAINDTKTANKMLLSLGSVMVLVGAILAQSMGAWVSILLTLILIPLFFLYNKNCLHFIFLLLADSIICMIIYALTKGRAFDELLRIANEVGSLQKLILGLFVLGILYASVFIVINRVKQKKFIIITIIMIFTLVISSIGFLYLINNISGSEMSMLSSRGYIWHYSNELLKENFIIGYGPDTLYYNFPQINPDQAIYLPDTFVDKPHNMYLQLVFDTGIFGLLGFISLFAVAFIKLAKATDLETDSTKLAYMRGIQLVIIAYMVQGIVNDNHIAIQPTVYALVGVSMTLVNKVTLFNKQEVSSDTIKK
ncbi:MAG: O-antigen polymerase family [Anaerocolumna sp.]|nr:O-antigen polymerase family [Anaerocolumna sp.]